MINLLFGSDAILCVFLFLTRKAFSSRKFSPHRPRNTDLCLAGNVMNSEESAGQRWAFISSAWNCSQLWICVPVPEHSKANIVVGQAVNEALECIVKIVFGNDTCLSQQPLEVQMMKCFPQHNTGLQQ